MDKISIKSSLYNYEVEFIDDVREKLRELMKEKCTFVVDRNIYNLYESLFEEIPISQVYLFDAVESKKNIENVLMLIGFWQQIKLKKNWKIICFGGGITQDITTFASNIYLRNVDWYFFPTTLLAMSDSCIGGKCGINLGEYKNQLGVFYPPKRIFICDKFLSTLSEKDIVNGWGELLKFSLTERKDFFSELKDEKDFYSCKKINSYIHQGLVVKKKIIEKDEFEGDLRRILNFGHTFGHALEAYTYNEVPHGTAVLWGIDVVNYISYKEKILEFDVYSEIKDLIRSNFISKEIVIDNVDRFFSILTTDKKVKNNTLYLVLLEKLSKLIIYPKEIDDCLKKTFRNYLEETHEYYNN